MPHKLDEILARRAVPEMRPHLVEKIIAAAQVKKRQGVPEWRAYLEIFSDFFVLPQPAMVLALLLFFGLTLGLNTGVLDFSQDAGAQNLSSFMDIRDSFDMGEWL